MKLNGLLNIVVVRRARESTNALGPIKDRANLTRTINVNREIGTDTCSWATHVNLYHASRHAKNRIEVHDISTSTSIVTHGSGALCRWP